MSVTIDKEKAKVVFLDALALVSSGAELPQEWVDRVRLVGTSPNKTFIAMLGTALLSRATDPRVDTLVLKAGAEPSPGFESYSARSVATEVLAPMAVEHRIDIGTRGREPLNNQPFFRYERIHPAMVVKGKAKGHLLQLIDSLEALKCLAESELLPALAAFIAVRRAAVRKPLPRLEVIASNWTLHEFVHAVSAFVTEWSEDGKRGQALVAAALDLRFAQVRLGHVNDPGRLIPGDVFGFLELGREADPVPVEVRQKPTPQADIVSWAAALARAGVKRGMYVLLAPGQPDLGVKALFRQILEEHNVVVTIYDSVESFLQATIIWSDLEPEEFMGAFAKTMQHRLEEAGVTPETVMRWTSLFGEP